MLLLRAFLCDAKHRAANFYNGQCCSFTKSPEIFSHKLCGHVRASEDKNMRRGKSRLANTLKVNKIKFLTGKILRIAHFYEVFLKVATLYRDARTVSIAP